MLFQVLCMLKSGIMEIEDYINNVVCKVFTIVYIKLISLYFILTKWYVKVGAVIAGVVLLASFI
ncbi:TPA: hypothetical protein ACKFIU_002879, partial [Clostridioides difficile]